MFILEVLLSIAGGIVGLVYGLRRHKRGLLKRLERSLIDEFLKAVLLTFTLAAVCASTLFFSYAFTLHAFNEQTANMVISSMVVCTVVGALSYGSGYWLAYFVRLFEK